MAWKKDSIRYQGIIGMADLKLPQKAVREQIAGAVDLIVQISRMRDGGRRCASVTEVVGMEGDVIITQDLFVYDQVQLPIFQEHLIFFP